MLDSVLVWFRRDLRDSDNVALAEACRRARKVYCAFIFDLEILDALPSRTDRRVEFIHESLRELDQNLSSNGGGLIVRIGQATEESPRLAQELGVSAVFANRDYEPQAKARDGTVARALEMAGIAFATYKDQALFEHPEILTQSDRPFTVFTPYKKAWLKRFAEEDIAAFRSEPGRLAPVPGARGLPTLEEIGFQPTNLQQIPIVPGMGAARRLLADFLTRIERYQAQRDFPAVKGVSYLSVHLRFGTISIRELAQAALDAGALSAQDGAAIWLAELIWRDFYFMILDCFPHVVARSFKPEFDNIRWAEGTQADALFAAWCAGETGYPLVDAAMRQLNTTGYMHNRLRMVTASFLCKDLGIDWHRGEAYFAAHLNDFDLSANNGGWQWASSSGCDAQPYFRIFNPIAQSQRFDPRGQFIRRYLPELANVPQEYIHTPWLMPPGEQTASGASIGKHFPAPVIDHQAARRLTLERYAAIRK